MPISPSSVPSISPSAQPSQCADEPNWYWNVNEGWGCAQMSESFCSDVDHIFYLGKNVDTACCVCGGGNHIAPSGGSGSNPRQTEIPSSSPTNDPLCPIEDFLDHQYFAPFNDGTTNYCYKIDLSEGGVFALDVTNQGCSNDNFVDSGILSVFDFVSDDKAHFKNGDLGWSGQFGIQDDPTVTEVTISIVSINPVSQVYDVNLLFPSCSTAASVNPSISLTPSEVPSISPTNDPLCPIEDFLDHQYFAPFNDGTTNYCYKIDLSEGGVFALDVTNQGCSNDNFVDSGILSVFDFVSDDKAHFKNGDLGWSGQFGIQDDPTMTEVTISIVSINSVSQVYDVNLLFPYCSASSSSSPSGSPSVTSTPSMSMSPIKCVDEPDFLWSIELNYGCAQISNSFCDDFSHVWYNGKNTKLACCVCDGGTHVPSTSNT